MSYISNRDFLLEVAKGNVPGHAMIHKFGRNPDVDTATDPEDIWANGGLMYWPTAADTLNIVSTSSDDDGTPTTNIGAQTLLLQGLDGSFNEVSETVTLNGTTPVTTSNSYMRINRAYITSVGTYHGSNLGIISGTTTGGGNPMLYIPVGIGATELGRYTIPAGKTGYILDAHISVDTAAAKAANVVLYRYDNANDVTQPYSGGKRLIAFFDGASGELIWNPHPDSSILCLPEKTDVWWTVELVTANDTAVEIDFNILLVDN